MANCKDTLKRIGHKAHCKLKKCWKYRKLDIIFALLVLVMVLIEVLWLKRIVIDDCGKFPHHIKHFYDAFCFKVEDKFFVNTVITIICPVVSTVLSVSLSVYKDPVYGVSLAVFRSFRPDNKYPLEWMILIPIIILVLCVLAYYYCLFFTTTLLNLIALVYCFYFIIIEVKLMSSDSKQRIKIVRNVYSIYTSLDNQVQPLTGVCDEFSNSSSYTHQREDAVKILSSFVYENGLGIAYDKLAKYELNTLDNLLNISTNYFVNHLNDNPPVVNQIKKKHIKNILDYLKTIRYDSRLCFDDCKDKMDNGNSLLYALSLFKDYYNVDDLTNGEYGQEITSMVNLLTPKDDSVTNSIGAQYTKDNCKYLTWLSNKTLISSAKSEEIWYFSTLFKNYQYLPANSAFNDEYYFIFSSIYLFYYSRREVGEEFKTQADELLKEYAEVLRTRVLWKFARSYNFDDYLTLLSKLLGYYKNIDYLPYWYSVPSSKKGQMMFSPYYIIYWWVSFLFMGAATIEDDFEEKIREAFKKVVDEKKEKEEVDKEVEEELSYLANAISDYNKEGETLFDEINDYFKLIGDNPKGKNDGLVDYYYISKFKLFTDKQNNKDLVKAYLDSSIVNDDYYGTLQHDLDTIVKMFPLYSDEDKGGADSKNWNETAIVDLASVENERLTFDTKLRQLINADFVNKYSSDSANNVDSTLFRNFIFNYQKENDSKVQTFKGQDAKDYKYMGGTLKFKASVTDKTINRKLNDVEINEIILKEYSQKDGLYLFNLPSNKSKGRGIYATREELVDLIKKYYCYMCIDLDYTIEYSDFKDMFTLVNQDTKEENESSKGKHSDSKKSSSKTEDNKSTEKSEEEETTKKEDTSTKK